MILSLFISRLEVNCFRFLLLSFAVFGSTLVSSQSLRINEVSQGPSGSKEYVELVVIGNSLTNCSSQPQCLDLRGWILDDNNGYFSNGDLTGTGLANGAIRFANNPLWQCINAGTIIVIYNDLDQNASVPVADQSAADGNCKLVIPVSSNLFERHEAAPSTTSMLYASTGWISGGAWGPISMANGDDSFQIYAPTNTTVPVHGVSWGNNNSNNFIYFNGAAGGLVFSATNTTSQNLSLQANWTSSPVATAQTPGVANSTQNGVYLGSMNLNCSAPLVLTVNPINATCAGNCNGSATLTISGGQTPYQTPVWSTGISGSSISNVCPNSYSVQVTDANGCTTTANFAIQEDAGFTLSTTGAGSICSGQSTTITASGATTYQWDNGLGAGSSFVVNPTTTTTYNVIGTTGNCSSSVAVTVTVVPTPSVNAGIDQIVCVGQSVTLTAVGANQLDWDNGIANGQAFVPGVGETIYTVTGSTNGCSASDQVTVTVVPNLIVDAGDDQVICTGQSIVLAATGANQYAWSNGVANGSVVIPPNGVTTYTVIGTSGTCSGSDQLTVIVEDCGWELEMPNVFSPNGDNANDLFVPLNKVNVVVERFEIFNRWGNLMYSSSDQNISWDGKDQAGNISTEGVYFFKLRFTDGSQVKNEIHGFVHLLK